MSNRPKFVSDEHLEYLNTLRETRAPNLFGNYFGARPYLLREFPKLSKSEAAKVVVYWMKTLKRNGEP